MGLQFQKLESLSTADVPHTNADVQSKQGLKAIVEQA